ncbi:MAG: BMP family ABC transporter substrate-binding protein [Oscillospiraceae bacterium]
MKFRKLAAAVMAAAMLFTVGCGSTSGSDSKADSTAASDAKGIAKEDVKVGVIHIGNPADGSGYSYAHDQGIVEMQKNLDLKDDQIVRKNNIPDDDPTATENAINECIEEGCNIIFGTSYNYMDTMEKLADEYPDIYFCHGTGYKNNGKNMNNYFGRIYQARYLSGIVAGLKTQSNKIGYVSAMGKDNSECTGGIDAFAMGVNSVNPDAQVFVKVTNSWYSPTEETNAAKALISDGCDVIAQHCDTPNPQLEAENAGVWGVGYNSDMSKDAPKATLTSVVWNWGAYYTSQVQEIIDGKWNCENYYGGMKEGLLDIAPLSKDLCTDEMQKAVDDAKAKIVDGSFNVFDGVIETNDGKTVGEEGKTLDDDTIKGGINWYFKNVVVK